MIVIEVEIKWGMEAEFPNWVDGRIREYQRAKLKSSCRHMLCVLCDFL
jgi:hypothetical protein